jgi:hypothetical protein
MHKLAEVNFSLLPGNNSGVSWPPYVTLLDVRAKSKREALKLSLNLDDDLVL